MKSRRYSSLLFFKSKIEKVLKANNKVVHLLITIVIVGYGCQNPTSPDKQQLADFSSTKDYFPEKMEIKYAKGFTLHYYNNYKTVDIINRFSNNKDTQHYVLVQRGTPVPKNSNKSYTFIEIPIRSIICLSSTHFGLTDFLNANALVIGLSDTNYVSNPEIRAGIHAGKIKEVGKGDILNSELIVMEHPDVLMTVGSTIDKKGNYQSLITAGIKIIPNSEWLEATPLGRAEWVKLLAALLNKEQLATEKFSTIEKSYTDLCNLIKGVNYKPTVITGSSYKGIWFVPGGNTFMANLFKDAGTDYYWAKDSASGILELNLEAVYPIALNATIWFNMGIATTRKEVIAQDSRFKVFKSVKTGQLYNCNKRVNKYGSNDYWESGIMNPHLILADIIKIAHPEIKAIDSLTYYKKIE